MHVFVATKVKNAELWLPRFIQQVESLEGDISRIACMYGNSRDMTLHYLKHWQSTSKHPIAIYRDPYIPVTERHGASLTRIKQDIQRLLQEGDETHYLNLDCDLVELPKTLIPDLAKNDKDLIAAMVWTENRTPKTFFDIFEYRMSGCMFHPYRPPGLNATEPFTADSVSTCYLAKREAELSGEYSNPYPHIPFCKSLKNKGFQIWVDPRVNATHFDLELLGIMHQALDHPYGRVPFITCTGEKVIGSQVVAERFHIERGNYERRLQENKPEVHKQITDWLEKRPLITASYKVLNEAEYIEYSLKSIYDCVDKIDIVYGIVKQNDHTSFRDETPEIIKHFPDPKKKIRFIEGSWQSKEEVQAKLLEVCESKWMLYIDGDEVLTPEGARATRQFCQNYQNGEMVIARPKQFLHFLHDFKHVAYSLNPISPWAQFGLPHAFLVWREVPGLNFASFHTIPVDGFGYPITQDLPQYRNCQTVLDDVVVYHFGNAKKPANMLNKIRFERRRDRNPLLAEEDWWFTGEMPLDFAVADFNPEDLPALMHGHPYFRKTRIRITKTSPSYKFEVLTK